MRCLHALVLTASLSTLALSSLAAQRTFIVDASNGPGTDFTELQKAVDTAQPGDRVVVRNGIYKPPTINKGITISSVFYGAVLDGTRGVLLVSGVPSGQRAVFSGFAFDRAIVQLENNKGCVVFSGIANAHGIGGFWPTINIVDCDAVSMHKCALKSSINLLRSRLQISDSIVMPTLTPVGIVGGGIGVNDSRLDLTNTTVKGGHRASNFAASSAITTIAKSEVVIRGADTLLEGGFDGSTQVESIRGNAASAIRIEASARRLGAVTGFGMMDTTKNLSLGASYAAIVAPLDLIARGQQGDLVAIYAGLPRFPIEVPGLGDWWLEPSSMFVVSCRPMPTSEVMSVRIPAQQQAALRGLAIGFQAISVDLSAAIKISNATLDSIH